MKLNKKGFTLVELLAVIVILAVIMLVAVTAVGPAITNSKKSAFFSSVAAVEDAATLYATSEGITSTRCVTLGTLTSKGHLNNRDKNLTGVVEIKVSSNKYTYTYWVNNNDFSITKKTTTAIDSAGKGFDTELVKYVESKKVDGVAQKPVLHYASEKNGVTTHNWYVCDGSAGVTGSQPANTFIVNE